MMGGGTTIWYDFPNNSVMTWTYYSTVLNDTGGWLFGALVLFVFVIDVQICIVFSNLTDLQIRGEFRTGADMVSFDNVVLMLEFIGLAVLALVVTFILVAVRFWWHFYLLLTE